MVKSVAAVAAVAILVFLMSILALTATAKYLGSDQPAPVVDYGATRP